jgi:ferredoxin
MDAQTSSASNGVTLRICIDADEHVIAGVRGTSILQAMRDAGLDPPSSCEAGQCGTCLALLKSGEVTMEHTTALSARDIADNLILTCQAQPVSDRIDVDFDDI